MGVEVAADKLPSRDRRVTPRQGLSDIFGGQGDPDNLNSAVNGVRVRDLAGAQGVASRASPKCIGVWCRA